MGSINYPAGTGGITPPQNNLYEYLEKDGYLYAHSAYAPRIFKIDIDTMSGGCIYDAGTSQQYSYRPALDQMGNIYFSTYNGTTKIGYFNKINSYGELQWRHIFINDGNYAKRFLRCYYSNDGILVHVEYPDNIDYIYVFNALGIFKRRYLLKRSIPNNYVSKWDFDEGESRVYMGLNTGTVKDCDLFKYNLLQSIPPDYHFRFDASESNSIIITSGRVSQWKDLSKNEYHVIQNDPSKRPVISEGGLRFTKSNSEFLVNNNHGITNQPTTLITVVKFTSTTNNQVIFDGNTPNSPRIWLSGNDFYMRAGTNIKLKDINGNDLEAAIGVKYVIIYEYNSNESKAWITVVDSIKESNAVNPGNYGGDDILLGGSYYPADYFNGVLYEIVGYSRILSENEIIETIDLLSNKWL